MPQFAVRDTIFNLKLWVSFAEKVINMEAFNFNVNDNDSGSDHSYVSGTDTYRNGRNTQKIVK